MVAPGDRVLVGVSGGADSMVLLHLFHQLAAHWQISLGVAHLNHGLRGDAADEDAALVCRTAASLELSCHMEKADVKKIQRKHRLSPEDAARQVRYAFFEKTMKQEGCTRLALGHHLDDNAEQVLLAVLRGSGTRGLGGILPVRGRHIRPLINIRKNAIEQYARKNGIVFRNDESNTDLTYTRNHIRHQLLPFLSDAYNPRIHHHLGRLADILRNEEAWLTELTEQHYAALVIRREADAVFLCGRTLCQAPLALSRRLVRRAIEDCHGSLKRISFDHITAVLDLLTGHADKTCLHLPAGIIVRRNSDQLVVQQGPKRRHPRLPPVFSSPEQMTIPLPFPDTVQSTAMGMGLCFFSQAPDTLPDWGSVSPHQAFFDLEKIQWPLVLRFPRPGDRFFPLGAPGSRKLKKFFIDHHIPPEKRSRSPVLADAAGILWLVGHRMDTRVRVTPETRRVLGVDFFLLDA